MTLQRLATSTVPTPLSSILAVVVLLLLHRSTPAHSASYYDQYSSAQQQQSSTYAIESSRRERNLDHWDADTLAAYLGLTTSSEDDTKYVPLPPQEHVYAGHDAAILFYAQWCPNCHALAPNYDAIGTLLHAGSAKSNLIMALFDCEQNSAHMALCKAAGVKNYPTVMYIGSGTYHDTDPVTARVVGRDKSAGPMGATPLELRRAVKFQGDWRYGDQVLDWIKAMRGLSRWHRLNTEGWLSVLRRGMFGMFRKPGARGEAGSLPVGVPPKLADVRAGGGSGSSTVEANALKKQVKTLEKEMVSYDKLIETSNEAVLHASYTIDSLLLPTKPKDGELGADCMAEGSSYPPFVDVFAALKKSNGWDATAESSVTATDGDAEGAALGAAAATAASASTESKLSDEYILRSCVVDLTLDYCTRVSTRVTTEYLDELSATPDAEYPALSELDGLLSARTEEVEHYCVGFDKCYVDEFKEESCRPEKCPFKNEVACRYAANCLDPRIKKEYMDALSGKIDTKAEGDRTAASTSTGTGAWGVA